MTKWGKITYGDGSYVVGPFDAKTDCVMVNHSTLAVVDGQNFEFVDRPRPEEPHGLGAVVTASLRDSSGEIYFTGRFVRGQIYKYGSEYDIWENSENNMYSWDDLEDVEILSRGYTG